LVAEGVVSSRDYFTETVAISPKLCRYDAGEMYSALVRQVSVEYLKIRNRLEDAGVAERIRLKCGLKRYG
jgi:hypothetical protein